MTIRTLLLTLCLAATAACDGGPTGNQGRLSVAVEGSGQEGLPGLLLQAPLVVRVTRPDGSPVHLARVRFETAAGTLEGAETLTNAEGKARAWWRLPAQASGPLAATAHVDGAPSTGFTAAWLPPGRADLVLANTGSPVRMLFHTSGVPGPAGSFVATFTDSLPLVPFAPQPALGIAAFVSGRPPIIRDPVAWTAGRDTLRLAFADPVSVPVTLWIMHGPFETVLASTMVQMDRARSVWAGAGIQFPDVRVIDATAHPNIGRYKDVVEGCGMHPLDIGFQAGRTNVYVVANVTGAGNTAGAIACGMDYITLTAGYPDAPELLAHEFGHTFGLVHVAGSNVMNPTAVHSGYTAGQIFWAHVDTASSIPRRHARAPARNCRLPNQCLPIEFNM